MYNDEYAATAAGAAAKVSLLKKNPLGYFLLSALAGAYIGFGILLSFTVSGTLGAIPMNKIAMGLSFGIALSLVIIAGAELFTGTPLSSTTAGGRKRSPSPTSSACGSSAIWATGLAPSSCP